MCFSGFPANLIGQRTLATIVFTDAVNFSTRMVLNEEHTLKLIDRDFQIMQQLCHQFSGQVIKTLGDGIMMYFASAIQAVTCAWEIQKALEKAAANQHPADILNHRIGIHLGDVFFREADILGNGVNIAARLQTQAEPGGICISQTVYDVVKSCVRLPITSWGPTKLKGINEPLPLYQIRCASSKRVLISHRQQEPEISLATQIHTELKAAGYQIVTIDTEPKISTQQSENSRLQQSDGWLLLCLEEELRRIDYLLLLLSQQSATSELITEEVRRAKELRTSRPNNKPGILPIRLNYCTDWLLNYNLHSYLEPIKPRDWRSPSDTPNLVQEVLAILSEEQPLEIPHSSEESPAKSGSFFPQNQNTPLPPVPSAPPEIPEGSVGIDSKFYISRPPIEERCYETIVQPGALIRIKAPRQMGKTSLMARILQYGQQQGYQTVPLNFQFAEQAIFEDLTKLLKWFCINVGRGLKLPNKLADYWDEEFGIKISCKDYFENYLLTNINNPIILALDEVDLIFPHSQVADDFFGLLRAWHEESKYRDIWKNLRILVVHSTEVYIPLNFNQSPFNVGLPIELPEFNQQQVWDLIQRHGLNWNTSEVESLMAMIGGHPYLIRLALYHIARNDITLAKLLETAATEAGLYSDHLRRQLWTLGQHPELAVAMKQVVATTEPVELGFIEAFKLHGMGLVNLAGNQVSLRCDLYRQYFGSRLGVIR